MTKNEWENDFDKDDRTNLRRPRRSLLSDAEYNPPLKPQETVFNSNVVISSPNSFKDVQSLIDNLRKREPVIFNLEAVSKESAQRILDFMSGAAYALGGSMKRIKEFLFLVTPEGVSITVPIQ